MKNRLTAGLLAILLGGFGVHKFYLGKTTEGIIHILFVWTGIPSIIGVVEGVIMLTQTDEEFKIKYNLDSVASTHGAFGSGYSKADELMKFKDLLDKGAITQEEYQKKKRDLL